MGNNDNDNEIEKEFKRARYIYLSIYFGLIFYFIDSIFLIAKNGAGTKS
jgi:hypothetical protein